MADNLTKFMDIWEIEHHFKCPVVGAMLTVEKHRSILKKCGYNVRTMKPYQYHRVIMEKLNSQNNVSQKVNNYIRSKAGKYMKQIETMPETAVRALWKTHLENGNVGPMMYAIVSHVDTGIELLTDVSGEVHMQSHANMTEVFTIRKQLGKLKDQLNLERRKLLRKNDTVKELVGIRKADMQKISVLEAENRTLKQQARPVPAGNESVSRERDRIRELEAALEGEKQTRRALERKHKALQIDLFSARSENEVLQKELAAIFSAFTPPDSRDLHTDSPDLPADSPPCTTGRNCTGDDCPQYRLCAKRIFMIGGITKMKSHYKDIVENAGGVFDYHDGYMRNASANLEAKVKRCDMVICPVNCNSHNACARVKKLCNQYNKELKILSSSSLSAVAQALFTSESPVVLN